MPSSRSATSRRISRSIACSCPASRRLPTDMMESVRQKYLAGTLSVVGGLLLWEAVSRVLIANPLFLAAPTQIAQAVYALTLTGEMGRHVWISSIEFAIGYVIASVIGIAFGFGMANSVRFKQALQPWISGLYATPTIALAPLFILWLGIGIWSKVLVVIFLVLFPVTINTEAGLPQIREYARLSTTVINAYLQPILERYLHNLRTRLVDVGVTTAQAYVMQSNGGTATFDKAAQKAAATLLSGPAGGVTAGARLSR